MRLAILIYSLHGGGAERQAANLANAWTDAGHEVVILVYGPDAEIAYRLSPGVVFRRLWSGEAPAGGVLPFFRRILRVRMVLDEIRPDVVLGFMSTANVLCAVSSVGKPWRTVGSERASPRWQPRSVAWRLLRACTYGLLDAVTAQTATAAKWLGKNTLARRVSVIPNAAEWPLVGTEGGMSPRRYLREDRRVLLGVGRLEALKGFRELIECFASLADSHPDWDLVIIGEGAERRALEARAAESGLAGRVRLPGRMANMTDWYERADLFALSSHHEGFPNALLEAMAAGVPVVSRDCDDGPREIIRDGVDGFLTPFDDLEAFAAALGRLMADAELRKGIGLRAREVRDRFSLSAAMALWTAILQPPA